MKKFVMLITKNQADIISKKHVLVRKKIILEDAFATMTNAEKLFSAFNDFYTSDGMLPLHSSEELLESEGPYMRALLKMIYQFEFWVYTAKNKKKEREFIEHITQLAKEHNTAPIIGEVESYANLKLEKIEKVYSVHFEELTDDNSANE